MDNRPRLISPAFWMSESVADLTFRQRTLFIGLITNADDQGRLKYSPALIRAQVFPYDDIPLKEIGNDLREIHQMGGITIYTANGDKAYIQVVKWWKFQHHSYAKPSRFPAPDGWEDGWNFKTNRNQMSTQNWPKSGPDTRGYTGGYTVPNMGSDTIENTVENTGDKVKESKVKESKHAAPVARVANPNSHPAIQVYRDVAHLYPKGIWKQKVIDSVGDEIRNLGSWREVCEAYVGLGWNPKNVKTMLEFFERNEVPGVAATNRRGTGPDGRKLDVDGQPIRVWRDVHVELETEIDNAEPRS